MLYNIPGRCGVDIMPDTVARLAKECRNIVSIKEASGSVERVGELRRNLPDCIYDFERRRFAHAPVYGRRRCRCRERGLEFVSI